MTSFGHLICAASPVARSTTTATATPARSVSSAARRSGGGRSSVDTSSEEPAGASQRRPIRPRPLRLLLRHRNRALGLVGVEHPLRRLGLLGVEIGTSEAAAQQRLGDGGCERGQTRSSRTAETLYSGVPISGSPTSCVSQLTRASAKCSAIQTRPG